MSRSFSSNSGCSSDSIVQCVSNPRCFHGPIRNVVAVEFVSEGLNLDFKTQRLVRILALPHDQLAIIELVIKDTVPHVTRQIEVRGPGIAEHTRCLVAVEI